MASSLFPETLMKKHTATRRKELRSLPLFTAVKVKSQQPQKPKSLKEQLRERPNPFIQEGQFSDEELPIAQLIQRRRIQMLIHSRIYYVLDQNLITDKQFDEWGRELVKLQADYPEIASRICYADAFKDWDASTGAFLPLEDDWVVYKAQHLLSIQGGKNEHEEIQQSTRKASREEGQRKTNSKQRSNNVPERRRLFG